jgi:hypothetical protein
MVQGSEFAVITTRFSTWKPNPNFPNVKSDGWMLWPNFTTESNTTKENGTFSVTPVQAARPLYDGIIHRGGK